MCDYSGVKYKGSNLLLPKLEHGLDFWERRRGFLDDKCDFNYLFQGAYKVNDIHKENPYTPVYVIGPYVHYIIQKY